jgi:hypothetical protein
MQFMQADPLSASLVGSSDSIICFGSIAVVGDAFFFEFLLGQRK